MDKTEIRDLTTEKIEIREDDEGNKTLSGYVVKWGMRSEVLGMFMKFRETIQRGAFTESLNSDDQRFLWSHDLSKVLGRRKNNTLRMQEDGIGLRFELDLPNTSLGRDTYESIKRGDVDGVSFGFKVLDDDVDESEDIPVRSVKRAQVREISAVAFPAYPDSEVSARGYDPMKQHDKEMQEYRNEKASKIKLLTII